MANAGLQNRLGTLFRFGVVGNLSDGQLVQQFLTAEDGADQVAFSALVERHGPMVLSVCRQVLGKSHDAEDAFQAAFLILARKAGSLRAPDSLANWLHGVALRVARRARANAARRSDHERRCASLKLVAAEPAETRPSSWPELHAEIARLPAHYRQPVVLCYLEGLSTDEAALRIGCPKGTIHSRLSRARERLRERLDRGGLAKPLVLLGVDQTAQTMVTVPALLLNLTVRSSLVFAGRQAAGTALASTNVTTLARGVLCGMLISKLTFVGAAAFACVLALGSALSFGQLGHGNRRQEPATAAPEGADPQAALTRSVDKLESGLDETARRNAEMKRELQGIRTNLEAIRAASRPTNGNAPVMQLADSLKQPATPAVTRLADALKRHPPPRGSMGGDRMQVYMMDLVDGGTTLIADEPNPGLTRCSNPRWSHDGSRIFFDAAPAGQEPSAHLMSIEVREERPTFADLGPGACPTFSADDKKVAFLGFGSPPRDQAGVWIMEADGSGRRRAGEFGAPLWSPDGREFLINDFSDNVTQTILMNLDKLTDGILAVEGRQIFSWPTWVSHGTLVSCLATNNEGDSIALLDVTKPAEAKIIEVLWKRGPDLDVTPRWPLYSAETGRGIFIGVDPTNKRTFYSVRRGESGRAKRLEPDGQHDRRGGLTLSPNGRYLLFNANRPAPLS